MRKEDIYKQVFCRDCNFEKMSIQDSIYAYQVAIMLLNESKELLPNLYKEIELYVNDIYNNIVKKLNKLNVIYTVKLKETNLPYMEFLETSNKEECRLWLFSDIDYADKCVKYYSKYNLSLTVEEVENDNFIRFLKDMVYLGFDSILVDNGLLYIELKFNDFIDITEEHMTIKNSQFIKKYIDLIQAYCKKIYPQKIISEKEETMLESIIKANFLVPIKVNQVLSENKTDLEFPQLINDKNQLIQPVFTDWREFRKWDKSYKYIGYLVDFENLYKIFTENKKDSTYKISINPFSINFILNEKNFLLINKKRKEIENG